MSRLPYNNINKIWSRQSPTYELAGWPSSSKAGDLRRSKNSVNAWTRNVGVWSGGRSCGLENRLCSSRRHVRAPAELPQTICIQFSASPYSKVHHSTVQYNTVQYSAEKPLSTQRLGHSKPRRHGISDSVSLGSVQKHINTGWTVRACDVPYSMHCTHCDCLVTVPVPMQPVLHTSLFPVQYSTVHAVLGYSTCCVRVQY